jgi:hypothetical protein
LLLRTPPLAVISPESFKISPKFLNDNLPSVATRSLTNPYVSARASGFSVSFACYLSPNRVISMHKSGESLNG